VTVLDNCGRTLESDVLCTVLTEPYYKDRLLGVNRTMSAPTTTTWVATGNNLLVKGDLSSRTLLCRIDPQYEHAEQRELQINLHEEVPRRRGELVVAALTIIRALLVSRDTAADTGLWAI